MLDKAPEALCSCHRSPPFSATCVYSVCSLAKSHALHRYHAADASSCRRPAGLLKTDHLARNKRDSSWCAARTEIDPVFEHACADRLGIREVALLQSDDRTRDLGSRDCLQIREPRSERLLTVGRHVVAYFRHFRG